MTDDSADTSHDGRSRAPLPRPVRALVAARAVNRLGAFALPFTAAILVEDFGTSVTTAGLVVASFGVATIPSRLAGGLLADRWGRRPTMLLGLVGCAVALLAFAASPTLLAAAVSVTLLGLVFELYEPPSQAIVADLCPPEQRPRAYSLLGTALAVAGVAAGLLAAALAALRPALAAGGRRGVVPGRRRRGGGRRAAGPCGPLPRTRRSPAAARGATGGCCSCGSRGPASRRSTCRRWWVSP